MNDAYDDGPYTDVRPLHEREPGVIYPTWRESGKATKYATPTKVCKRCGVEREHGEYGAFQRKDGSYNLHGVCCVCVRQRKREWYEENREHHNALSRAWQKANRDKVNRYQRSYRERNRQQRADHARAYRITRAAQRAGLLRKRAA